MATTTEELARDLIIKAMDMKQFNPSGGAERMAEEIGRAYKTLILALDKADEALAAQRRSG